MPHDIAIISPLDRKSRSEGFLRAVGETSFIFEPFENDIQFDNLKLVQTFSGTQKLLQSILRIIMQPKGSYFEDEQWGSSLDTLIGSKRDQERIARSRQSIIDALKHYNEVNADNPDSDEIIDTIDELRVVEDLDDPRVLRIYLGITTESGISVGVTVPQVE